MRIALVTLLVALTTGCSSLLYRVPIMQGNVLSQEQVSKLEPGMTKPQVRYLLGTPLINSDFGKHRWDYVFYYRNRRGVSSRSRMAIYFENGKVAQIKGEKTFNALVPENREFQQPEPVTQPRGRGGGLSGRR